MLIRTLETGSFAANCYLVACKETLQGLLIDPGDDAERIIEMVKENNVTIKYIFNTHGHFDHTGANEAVRAAFNAPILIHAADGDLFQKPRESLAAFFSQKKLAKPDSLLTDGQQVQFGKLTATVIATPGHTKGSSCLLVEGVLFSGDTLFAGSVGRTDLPGGSAEELFESIKEKLLILPPETKVYPGHGPDTTIGMELANNPYIKQIKS